MRSHEHQLVVVGMANAELDVGPPNLLEALKRIFRHRNVLKFRRQPSEIFIAQLVE